MAGQDLPPHYLVKLDLETWLCRTHLEDIFFLPIYFIVFKSLSRAIWCLRLPPDLFRITDRAKFKYLVFFTIRRSCQLQTFM